MMWFRQSNITIREQANETFLKLSSWLNRVFAGDLEQIALFPHLQRAIIIVSTAPFWGLNELFHGKPIEQWLSHSKYWIFHFKIVHFMLCAFHLKFLKRKRMALQFHLDQLDKELLKSNENKGVQCSAWGICICDVHNLYKWRSKK